MEPSPSKSTEVAPSSTETDPALVTPLPTAPPELQSSDPESDARAALHDPDLERPVLNYPHLESHGAVSISFTSPDVPPSTGALSCLWKPYENGGPDVVALGRISVVLAGEQVEIWLGGRTSPDEYSSAFIIHRHGAASYVAGPDSARIALGWEDTRTGSVEFIDKASDWSNGKIRFDSLAPNQETARPPTISLADWVRPLGGDPALTSLSGTVEWACEPPPPTLPSAAEAGCGVAPDSPFCLGDPKPLVLVVGGRRQVGVNDCGGLSGETCGPQLEAISADYTVRVPTGGLLRFELPDQRSHFLIWSLSWVAQREAERAQTQNGYDEPVVPEPAWKVIDEGVLSEGAVLQSAAPPIGEWSVILGWTDDRDDEGDDMRSFFRVVVGG